MRTLLAFSIVILSLTPRVFAGEDGVAGNWKVSLVQNGNVVSFWHLLLENKGGKLTGKVESLGGAPEATMGAVRVAGDLLEFSVKLKGGAFNFQGKLPKAGGKKILGSLTSGTMLVPTIMEATSARNSFELDRDLLIRTPNDPRVFGAVLNLVAQAKEQKVPAKDVQEWVDIALASADNFGPVLQLHLAQKLLDALLTASPVASAPGDPKAGYASVAIATARKAERLLDPRAPLEARLRILTALGTALKQAGQAEQTKEVEVAIEKLEEPAYREHDLNALDFKVPRFLGRKSQSTRAVLVELFTGAQCPPCVAADLAFDALARSYTGKEVVLLEYHLHVPGPDALTNADTELREAYYSKGDNRIEGTPTILFNGKVYKVGGGGREDAEDIFQEYTKIIGPLLEKPAAAGLQASATRKGDKIQIKASVQGLEKPGPKVKLRLVLVEDWARYKGRNGIGYFHRVVRAFPGRQDGLPLVKKDLEQSAVVDLADVRLGLTQYLDKAAKEEPFLDSQRPMRLRNLSVVAFIQDDATQEILQAAQAPVKDE